MTLVTLPLRYWNKFVQKFHFRRVLKNKYLEMNILKSWTYENSHAITYESVKKAIMKCKIKKKKYSNYYVLINDGF